LAPAHHPYSQNQSAELVGDRRGNPQFRNWLESLQSAARELQTRQVPNKAQDCIEFSSRRAQEEVPFSAKFRKCAPPLLNI